MPTENFRGEIVLPCSVPFVAGVRSKTPPVGYFVFLSYKSSTCKTAIEHLWVPFSNASQRRVDRPQSESQGTLSNFGYPDLIRKTLCPFLDAVPATEK